MMPFRKDESTEVGFERAVRYLSQALPLEEKREIENYVDDLTIQLGPVVECYPSWHPLVSNHNILEYPITRPGEDCGYRGLDHNVYFANGFISCPYKDGEKIINSVNEFWKNEAARRYAHVAEIEARRIDKLLYNSGTDPILVECKWLKPIRNDRTIPKDIAVGLMLEMELPNWRRSTVGETWETMRTYLMGEPCGKRSSMFLDQEAGQAMKKVYETIVYTGMYGPLKV